MMFSQFIELMRQNTNAILPEHPLVNAMTCEEVEVNLTYNAINVVNENEPNYNSTNYITDDDEDDEDPVSTWEFYNDYDY